VASFAATRLDSLGFHHVTLWDGVGELAVFAVNPAVWDAWTADRRALVRSAAEDASKQLAAMVATEQEAALAALKARGINALRLTATGRASFAAAARPTYDRWAAVAGEDIVRTAESAVAAVAATRP
jgi:TRAP-type C4-dicarboxylate transport system substrate-binding protein